MSIKETIKDCLPPIALRQLRRVRKLLSYSAAPKEIPEWEYEPGGWDFNPAIVRGWDQPGVAESYANRWKRFLTLIDGTQPPAINHEAFQNLEEPCVDTQNQVMTLAYIVGRLAHHRDRLRILDHGGALGHHRAFLGALFPEITLDYTCCELPHVAVQGRKLNPEVRFLDGDAWIKETFDLVLASNSLQYVPAWEERLQLFAQVAQSMVFVTKLPVVQEAKSYVFLQRAEKYGYRTEYLAWSLNQAEFLEGARRCGLLFEREFLVWRFEPEVANAPEPFRHKGFLFRKPAPGANGYRPS